MPFFLLIVFGLWTLLILANDRGKHNAKSVAYYQEFPEAKRAEEVILRLELYREYKQDKNRKDPIGDALEDAGWQIYNNGYRPLSVLKSGRSSWRNSPEVRRRDEANSQMDWRFPTLESLGGICPAELQDRWRLLVQLCAEDIAALEQRGPKVLALEYVLACYNYKHILDVRDMARNNDCPVSCPWDIRLLANYFAWYSIIDIGYTPSTWEPFHPSTFTAFQNRFDSCWPPNMAVLSTLIYEDCLKWQDPNKKIGYRTGVNDVNTVITFDQYQSALMNFAESSYSQNFNPRNFVYIPSTFHGLVLAKEPKRNAWFRHLIALREPDVSGVLVGEARKEFYAGVQKGHCCRCCYYSGRIGWFSRDNRAI